MKRRYVPGFILCLLLVLCSCKESPLELSIRYQTLDQLTPLALVYSDDTAIGKITGVEATAGGDYLVTVALEPQFAGKATTTSRFYIDNDPQRSGRMAIILDSAEGGNPLQEGSVVVGAVRPGVFSRMMKSIKKTKEQAGAQLQGAIEDLKTSLAAGSKQLSEQLDDALASVEQSLRDFEESFNDHDVDADLEQLQDALDNFMREFKQAGEEVRDHIRQEVLPQLRRQLQELQEKMQDDRRKQEAEQLDEQIGALMSV